MTGSGKGVGAFQAGFGTQGARNGPGSPGRRTERGVLAETSGRCPAKAAPSPRGLVAWRGLSIASAPCDPDQVRARIRARARRLCAHINGAHADRVIERARRAGNRGLVMSYRPWLATSRVQDAIGHFAEAVAAYSLDHMDGFADALVQAYNCPLYFDDGHHVAIAARRPTDAGLRLDLAFTCRETGGRTDIRDLTPDDLFRLATSLLAPDRVLARAIGEVERFNASICSGADVHPLHRSAAHRARKAASDTTASRRAPASSHRREPSA